MARTSSPPYPGLSDKGNILIARANIPVARYEFNVGYAAAGALIGLAGGMIIPFMTPVVDFVWDGQNKFLVKLYRQWAEMTLPPDSITITPLANGNIIPLNLTPGPAAPAFAAPEVTGVHYQEGTAPNFTIQGYVILDGSRFTWPKAPIVPGGKNGRTLSDVNVLFVAGGKKIVVPGSSLIDLGGSIKVPVPNDVILGVSQIIVERPTPIAIGKTASGKIKYRIDLRQSKPVKLTPQGGLAYARLNINNQVAIFDPKDDSIKQILDVGDYVRATAVTRDLTRIYVVGNAGVSIIDGLTLKQVDANGAATPGKTIRLVAPGAPADAPAPAGWSVAVGANDDFLYVGSSYQQLYIIDIRPSSADFNKVVQVVNLSANAPDRISGVAVGADGRRLYLTAPDTLLWGKNSYNAHGSNNNGKIIVLNIDAADAPKAGAPNTRKYREVIFSKFAGLEPE